MDELQYLAHGFAAVTTWQNTGLMLTGILLGIVVGVLPGLGGPPPSTATPWPSRATRGRR
jgi:TctA family transporter